MEYCIWKAYQTELKNRNEISSGFDLLEEKAKKKVIIFFIIMISSFVEMIVSYLLFPKRFCYIIGFVLCFISAMMIMTEDDNNRRIHMKNMLVIILRKLIF